MDGFESVFDNYEDTEEKFDIMFDADSDGSLIDACCGFNEAGECETDFDELHQTDDDADPDDIADELGEENDTDNAPKNAEGSEGSDSDEAIDAALGESGEDCPVFQNLHQTAHNADVDDLDDELGEGRDTDNAPKGAEGTDTDPAIDMALGEMADDEFSANGVEGKSDADKMYDDYNEPEEDSALTGEGREVNMDDEHIEDEFDKMVESVLDKDATDYDDDGVTGDEGLVDDYEGPDALSDECNKGLDESFDDFMARLNESDEGEDSIEDPEWDHDGDSDLIDAIMGED